MFSLLYELYNNRTGNCVVAQNVSGDKIGAILDHVAKTINENGDVNIKILKARLNETVITDPKKTESLSVLVRLATEHYTQKTGKLVIEQVRPVRRYTTCPECNRDNISLSRPSSWGMKNRKMVCKSCLKKVVSENLRKVLANPAKTKKLLEAIAIVEDAEIHQDLVKRGFTPHHDWNTHTSTYTHPDPKKGSFTMQSSDKKGGGAPWTHKHRSGEFNGRGHQQYHQYMQTEAEDKLDLPTLETGDVLLAGKFKNKRAVIDGFKSDEHNQPVATTDKGDQKIFKPRIAKLMPGAEKPMEENVQGDVRKHKEKYPEKYCANSKCLYRLPPGTFDPYCTKHGIPASATKEKK